MIEHSNNWEWAMRTAYKVASITGRRMRVYAVGPCDLYLRNHYDYAPATASA